MADSLDALQPDIYQYLDFRAYLRDQFGVMQTLNSKMSQRWIARQAGFKTPQLLSMILSGKRKLKDERIAPLVDVLGLDTDESNYFKILVKLDAAGDQKTRRELLEHISVAFRDGLFTQLSDEGMEIFRQWYLLAIREIVELESFRDDPFWIASVLSIEPQQVVEGMGLLEQKGFLTKVNGKWARTAPSLHSLKKISPLLLSNFHMQMINKSAEAISLPRDQRYFEALTVSLPKSLVPELTQMIQRFIRESDALSERSERRDAIYQINVQMFPLTNVESGKGESC